MGAIYIHYFWTILWSAETDILSVRKLNGRVKTAQNYGIANILQP